MNDDTKPPGSYAEQLLGDETLRAIGLVAAESSLLEYLIEDHIGKVCELEGHTRKLVTDLMQMDKKLDFLKEALRPFLKDEALKKKFSEVLHDAKTAIADRNTVIHGIGVADTMELTGIEGNLHIKVSGQKKLMKFARWSDKSRSIPVDKVLDVARRLVECQTKLAQVLGECTDSDELRQKQRERQSRMDDRIGGRKKKE